jgi:ribosomal protein S18 acetylase RimI-like enzyme
VSVHDTVTVHRAALHQVGHLANVLAAAFQDDPVSAWLFPDPQDRALRQPKFFQLFLVHAFCWGEVHTTANGDGVALWLHVDPDTAQPPSIGADYVLRDALEDNHPRFMVLDELMRRTHPTMSRHAYLPFLGVRPGRQGHGIGRALLDHKLAELDATVTPAYLEASAPRSENLYRRAGFARLAAPINLPYGPTMQPMLRTPNTGRTAPFRAGRTS